MLGATGVLVAAFFLGSLYLQDVLGYSPIRAGLAFLPLVLVIGRARTWRPGCWAGRAPGCWPRLAWR